MTYIQFPQAARLWLAALAVACVSGGSASAAVLFSYDASGGQFPTDQGWSAFEIDTDGPLTAPNTEGTPADNANAAIEDLAGMNVLHIRDTIADGSANLPIYYYEWTPAQQNALINYGLKFTMVFQGVPTETSGKGNIRFGFNDTEFELQNDNISSDQRVEVLGLSSELAPDDGNFHTIEILGQKSGANFEFAFTFDGGPPTAMPIGSNPSPSTIQSSVYFGASSSGGQGTDIYVKSVVMETINVPEPTSGLLVAGALLMLGSIRRVDDMANDQLGLSGW